MNDQLRDQINAHLRRLRSADSQAAAVTWMTDAYKLFERCIEEIDQPEAPTRLVFMPQVIEVVKEVPKYMVPGPGGFVPMKDPHRRNWWEEKTIVYPDAPMPPSKPKPDPWTRKDTIRLEAAAKKTKAPIQRKGK